MGNASIREAPMPWKTRGRRQVYYRSVRTGDIVRSVHVGDGARGEQAAREDAEKRLRRRTEEIRSQRQLTECEVAGEPLRELEATTTWLVRAVLVVAGNYLHRGHEWRRRAA
jgi:hypothetical protein